MTDDVPARRRAVIVAGHRDGGDAALAALGDPDASVRAAAIGASARAGVLGPEHLAAALGDVDRRVRMRAIDEIARLSGEGPPSLLEAFDDPDVFVVERAAWASGERTPPESGAVEMLASLAMDHEHKLVREAAVASLGAIGDEAGLAAVLHATTDVATIRRRAVLALAPFEGSEVDAALERALTDRDWQTRQAAADILGVADVEL